MRLQDATFVVADTETTGVNPQADRIIEIGAVRVVGGEIVDRFSQLVQPGRSLSRRITEITGLTTAALVGAPTMAEVLPRFRSFVGDAILVGHNLPFDLGFLDAEAARLGLAPFTNAGLCTLRLARRILRGQRSKGLGAVADHYGIAIHGRHRALGDAEATAHVLLRFLAHLSRAENVETVAALLAFQHTRYAQPRQEPRHLAVLRKTLDALPARPGVYFMKDASGAVVYVGKARSLRQRVRSYFTAIEAHPPRLRQLVDTVRQVEWKETGSELSALLLESRLIKEMQPRFNRASRRYRNRPFVRLETDTPFPRASLAPYLLDDGAEYFGPLAGRRDGEVVIEVINRFFGLRECDEATFGRGQKCLYATMGRCLAPCAEPADAYADEVARVRAFLLGQDTEGVLDTLRAAMMDAAARREYERAGQARDWLRALERATGQGRRVAASVLDHHGVIVQPGEVEGTRQLFVVRYGRHAETLALAETRAEADEKALDSLLARHFGAEPPRPERYLKREIDEVRLLAHWLYVHRDSAQQVAFLPGTPLDAFARQVRAALDLAETPAADDPDEGADDEAADLLDDAV